MRPDGVVRMVGSGSPAGTRPGNREVVSPERGEPFGKRPIRGDSLVKRCPQQRFAALVERLAERLPIFRRGEGGLFKGPMHVDNSVTQRKILEGRIELPR
jgi:hypothetical protein